MKTIAVTVRQLPHGDGLPLPQYATPQSAGMDLLAATDAELTLAASERAVVPTGIAIALPEGFEAQVRPRSGLAAKHGVTVLNSPGTVDADYRGEIKVIIANTGSGTVRIERGMRIAQLVIAPVVQADWVTADSLPDSERGDGGFGSTGMAGGR